MYVLCDLVLCLRFSSRLMQVMISVEYLETRLLPPRIAGSDARAVRELNRMHIEESRALLLVAISPIYVI